MASKKNRFTEVTFVNTTPFQWELVDDELSEGQWSTAPPDFIAPGSNGSCVAKRRKVNAKFAIGSAKYEYFDSEGTKHSVVVKLAEDGTCTGSVTVPDTETDAPDVETVAISDVETEAKRKYFWFVVSVSEQGDAGNYPSAEESTTLALFSQNPLRLGESDQVFESVDIVQTYLDLPLLYVDYELVASSLEYSELRSEAFPVIEVFNSAIFTNESDDEVTKTYELNRSSTSSFTFGFNQSFGVTTGAEFTVGLPGSVGVSASISLSVSVGAHQELSQEESVTWTDNVSAVVPAGQTILFTTALAEVSYTVDFTATMTATLASSGIPEEKEALALACVPTLQALRIPVSGTLDALDGETIITTYSFSDSAQAAQETIRAARRRGRGASLRARAA